MKSLADDDGVSRAHKEAKSKKAAEAAKKAAKAAAQAAWDNEPHLSFHRRISILRG